MDNLGQDRNGCVIENKRRNKGQFIADFSNASKAEHPEWEEAILHLREGGCVTDLALCQNPNTYVQQAVDASNLACATVFVFTPVQQGGGGYAVAASSIKCSGNVVANGAVSGATLALLVTSLNTNAGTIGTWAVVAGSTTSIQLSGSTCKSVDVPWLL
jgi:hypothetical protein